MAPQRMEDAALVLSHHGAMACGPGCNLVAATWRACAGQPQFSAPTRPAYTHQFAVPLATTRSAHAVPWHRPQSHGREAEDTAGDECMEANPAQRPAPFAVAVAARPHAACCGLVGASFVPPCVPLSGIAVCAGVRHPRASQAGAGSGSWHWHGWAW